MRTYKPTGTPRGRRPTDVPVEVFQARYRQLAKQGWTASDMAGWLGWAHYKGGPDSERFRRTIGLVPQQGGGRYGRNLRRTVKEATALKLCEALGIDPVDIDL